MNLDGSHLTRLTNDPRDDSFPVWSPDGTRILFHSDRAGNFDLYVINPDGSGLAQLTTVSQADTFASWSPDGKKIVFQSKRDGNKEIYVMNANGSKQTRLTHSDVDNQFPSWSPDGSQIIYSTQMDGALQLAIMNADGSGQHLLTFGSESYSFPSWSPDGSWIVAAYETPDKTAIIRGEIRADGHFEYTGLTSGQAKDTQPRWSRDGKTIFFTTNRNGNFDIYRMDPDGNNLVWLSVDPQDEEAPSVYP
jgi:Tol biopolymer transport system component